MVAQHLPAALVDDDDDDEEHSAVLGAVVSHVVVVPALPPVPRSNPRQWYLVAAVYYVG